MRQLKFEVTQDDFVDFQLHYSRDSKAWRQSITRTRIVLALLYALMAVLFFFRYEGRQRLFAIAVPFAVGPIHIALIRKNAERRLVRTVKVMTDMGKANKTLGEKTLDLAEGKLIYGEEGETATLEAGNLKKIAESEKCLFLFRDEISAIIIPKSAFSSAEEKDEFLAALNSTTGSS